MSLNSSLWAASARSPFTATIATRYSVTAVSPVNSADSVPFTIVTVHSMFPLLLAVTLYFVNACEVGAVHVTVIAVSVIALNTSKVGELGESNE